VTGGGDDHPTVASDGLRPLGVPGLRDAIVKEGLIFDHSWMVYADVLVYGFDDELFGEPAAIPEPDQPVLIDVDAGVAPTDPYSEASTAAKVSGEIGDLDARLVPAPRSLHESVPGFQKLVIAARRA
jgi:hypothetical protein